MQPGQFSLVMSTTEVRQMVLFDQFTYDVLPSWEPEPRCSWGMALGLALVFLAWAPIAWLIWALT